MIKLFVTFQWLTNMVPCHYVYIRENNKTVLYFIDAKRK
jgi:hypothetical protein